MVEQRLHTACPPVLGVLNKCIGRVNGNTDCVLIFRVLQMEFELILALYSYIRNALTLFLPWSDTPYYVDGSIYSSSRFVLISVGN